METSNILVNAEESTHATDEIKLLILAVFIIILIKYNYLKSKLSYDVTRRYF